MLRSREPRSWKNHRNRLRGKHDELRGLPGEIKLAKLCLQHPSCLSWLEDVDGQSLVMSEGLRQILWEAITLMGEEEALPPRC